jgi:hypothetical protein
MLYVPPLSVALGIRVFRHCNGLDGQLFRVLGERTPAEYALGSLLVVFAAPVLDHHPGMGQAGEPVFVQALIAQSSAE